MEWMSSTRILPTTLKPVSGENFYFEKKRREVNMNFFYREPAIVKSNAITAASEAACLLLSVDETVKNPRSGQGADQMGGGMPPMGRGRGRPM